jgi:hypothetical protein
MTIPIGGPAVSGAAWLEGTGLGSIGGGGVVRFACVASPSASGELVPIAGMQPGDMVLCLLRPEQMDEWYIATEHIETVVAGGFTCGANVEADGGWSPMTMFVIWLDRT